MENKTTTIAHICKNSQTELNKAVLVIMRIMMQDYAPQYKKICYDKQSAEDFKNRMLKKLANFHPADIYDGYDMATEQSPEFLPNIPTLYAQVEILDKKRKQLAKNTQETLRMEASPEPTIQCNPMAMLVEARAKLKNKYPKDTEEARLIRLAIAREEHAKVMEAYEKKKASHGVSQDHACNFHNCFNPGTTSQLTGENINYYCSEHFRRAG